MIAWLLPIVGFPVTITRLVLGIKSLNAPSQGMAMAGIVLNIIFLFFTTGNAASGAYLGATGQLHH